MQFPLVLRSKYNQIFDEAWAYKISATAALEDRDHYKHLYQFTSGKLRESRQEADALRAQLETLTASKKACGKKPCKLEVVGKAKKKTK